MQAGLSSHQILQDIDDIAVAKGRKKEKSMVPSSCEPPHGSSKNAPHSAQDNLGIEAENVNEDTNDRPLVTVVPEDSSGDEVHYEEKKQHSNATPASPAVLNEEDSNSSPASPAVLNEKEHSNSTPDSPAVSNEEDGNSTPASPAVLNERKEHSNSTPASPAVSNEKKDHSNFTPASPAVSNEKERSNSSPASPAVLNEKKEHSNSSPASPAVLNEEKEHSNSTPASPAVLNEEKEHSNSTPAVLNEEHSNSTPASPAVLTEEEEHINSTPASPAVLNEEEHINSTPASPAVLNEEEENSNSTPAPPAVLNEPSSAIASQKASDAQEAGASASGPPEALTAVDREDESLSSSPANHVKSVTARLHVQEGAEDPVTLLLNYVGGDGFQQEDSETEQTAQVHDDERRQQRGNLAAPASAANLQTGRSVAVENAPSAMPQAGAAASNSLQPDHVSSEAAANGERSVENRRGKSGIEHRAGQSYGATVSDVLNTKSQAIILQQSEALPPSRNKFADMLADKDASGDYDVRWK